MQILKKFKSTSLTVYAISNWASLFINIAIGMFLTPFIIRHIDKTGYGIWVLVNSIAGYYGLLNLGVGAAITRYISHYTAMGNNKSLNQVTSTALTMFCTTGLVAILISSLFAGPLASFFNLKPESLNYFKYLIYLFGITIGISFPAEVFGAIVLAREKFVHFNIVSILQTLFRTLLTVLFLIAGLNLLGVGLASFFPSIFLALGYFFLFKHFAKDIKFSFSYSNLKTLKMLVVFGGLMTLIAISDTLRLSITNFIIGKILDMDSVAVFGVAVLLIRYARSFITSAMWVLTPRFAHLDGKNETESLKRLYLRSLTVSSLLSFGLCASIIIFGPRFINIWVGPAFNEAGVILIILASVNAFSLAQNPGISLMQARNKHAFYAIISIIEIVISIGLSLLLSIKYGLMGVTCGMVLPMMIVSFIVMPIYITRYVLNISLWENYKRILFSFSLSGAVIIFIFVTNIKKLINEESVITYFFSMGIYMTIGGVMAFFAYKLYNRSKS